MRIGIITFHWVTNYGAVLQAFALQQFLKRHGHEAEIINYYPAGMRIRRILGQIKRRELQELGKEMRIREFRRMALSLSARSYRSPRSLCRASSRYDAIITGSDQIWGEWFALNADKEPTLTYFLDFASSETARIAYAASFGANSLSPRMEGLIRPELSKFHCIGVRENSGKDIIEKIGLPATVVVDPTMLLSGEAYGELISHAHGLPTRQFFPYVLHRNQPKIEQACEYIAEKRFRTARADLLDVSYLGVREWVNGIRTAQLVLTNSFHGVAFSLIFRRPFIVFPVEGPQAGMNDRISTILGMAGLEERMLIEPDRGRIDRLSNEVIDWDAVDLRLRDVRHGSKAFLLDALRLLEGPLEGREKR